VLPALYAGFAGRTDRDAAEDLLHRWAGVEREPEPQPADSGSIVVNPDAVSEPGGERILQRRRPGESEPAPEPPTRAS
jgi:hypothetical protein